MRKLTSPVIRLALIIGAIMCPTLVCAIEDLPCVDKLCVNTNGLRADLCNVFFTKNIIVTSNSNHIDVKQTFACGHNRFFRKIAGAFKAILMGSKNTSALTADVFTCLGSDRILQKIERIADTSDLEGWLYSGSASRVFPSRTGKPGTFTSNSELSKISWDPRLRVYESSLYGNQGLMSIVKTKIGNAYSAYSSQEGGYTPAYRTFPKYLFVFSMMVFVGFYLMIRDKLWGIGMFMFCIGGGCIIAAIAAISIG